MPPSPRIRSRSPRRLGAMSEHHVQVERPADARAFLGIAGAFLAEREAENNLLFGIAANLLRDPDRAMTAPPYFAAVRREATLGSLGQALNRHPSILAKLVTTADHVSNGRIELGLGDGDGLGGFGSAFDEDLASLEEIGAGAGDTGAARHSIPQTTLERPPIGVRREAPRCASASISR